MIRVSVLYPNGPDAKFDIDYYANQHLKLVMDRVGSAIVSAEINTGLGSAIPGEPAPFIAVGHLLFNSLEEFQAAFGPHAEEIMGDIPNFTNTEPAVQISEIVE